MKRILPIIVLSQFFCTSLWFAGNAVIGDVAKQLQVNAAYLAYLVSAVQAGFIIGTLIFALLGIADRFAPGRVFLTCALIAAILNLGICLPGISPIVLLMFRFMTGFFLAGIYPVGMKIASDYYRQGLGKSLGFLVGALVIGTAFPHLLKSLASALPWQYVIFSTSLLSVMGGVAMFILVPLGPYHKAGQKISWNAFANGFYDKDFRAAALGYFGHMWELYAFWVFVPIMLTMYQKHNPDIHFNIPLLSFFIIAIGALSCVCSGFVSQHWGAWKTATVALSVSCVCCILSPLFLISSSASVFISFLLVWSIAVIADSPMFSTLVAQNAPAQTKGTSLTIVNCLGFLITIISIQLINALLTQKNAAYIYMLLAIGPILGLVALRGIEPKQA